MRCSQMSARWLCSRRQECHIARKTPCHFRYVRHRCHRSAHRWWRRPRVTSIASQPDMGSYASFAQTVGLDQPHHIPPVEYPQRVFPQVMVYHPHCRRYLCAPTSHKRDTLHERLPHQRHIVHTCSLAASGFDRATTMPRPCSFRRAAPASSIAPVVVYGNTGRPLGVLLAEQVVATQCDFRHILTFGKTYCVAHYVF